MIIRWEKGEISVSNLSNNYCTLFAIEFSSHYITRTPLVEPRILSHAATHIRESHYCHCKSDRKRGMDVRRVS